MAKDCRTRDIRSVRFSKRSLFDFDLNSIPDYAQKYGLLFPKNINSAIDVLVKNNYLDSKWNLNSLRDMISYYLFYPTIVAQQYSSSTAFQTRKSII